MSNDIWETTDMSTAAYVMMRGSPHEVILIKVECDEPVANSSCTGRVNPWRFAHRLRSSGLPDTIYYRNWP